MGDEDELISRRGFSLDLSNDWSKQGVAVRTSEEGNQQAEDDQKEMLSTEAWHINVVVEFNVNPADVLTFREDSETKRMIVTDTKEGLQLVKGLPLLSEFKEKWNAQELPVVLKFGSKPIETNQPQSQSNHLAVRASVLLSHEDHMVFLGQTTSIKYDDEYDQKFDDDNKTNPDKHIAWGSALQSLTEREAEEVVPDNMQPIAFAGIHGNKSNWSRKCKERAKILTELLDTERTYIDGLKELRKEFIKPFAKHLKKSAQVDVSSFGKKIETLIKRHDKIYKRFLKAENICIVFPQDDFAFIKMYKSCIEVYEETVRKLRQAASKKTFKWIFKKGGGRVSADPLGYFQERGTTLEKHPAHYILLLQQLKKWTPIKHPMFNDLDTCLTKMKATCDNIEVYVKQLKNDNQLLELFQEIDSKTLRKHGVKQLIVPGRKLVRQGDVYIRKSSEFTMRRAPTKDSLIFEAGWVVMCNDILVIVRGKKNHVIRMFKIALLETVLINGPIKPYSKAQKFDELYEVILRKRQENEKRRETFHYQERKRSRKRGSSEVISGRHKQDEDEFSIYLTTLEEANVWEKSIRKYNNSGFWV